MRTAFTGREWKRNFFMAKIQKGMLQLKNKTTKIVHQTKKTRYTNAARLRDEKLFHYWAGATR